MDTALPPPAHPSPHLGHVAGVFLLAIVGSGLATWAFKPLLGPVGFLAAQMIFFLALPALLARYWAQFSWSTLLPLSIPARAWVPAGLLGPAMVYAVILYEGFQTRFLFPMPGELQELYRESFGVGEFHPFWIYLSIGVGPAICEEFFFRGFLLGTLSKRLPQAVALVSTTLLFALLHPPVEVMIPILLLGLLLGLSRFASRSLLPAVAAHLINNILALTYILGHTSWLEKIQEYSHLRFAGAILLCAGCMLLTWRLAGGEKGQRSKVEG